jgi:hypothetical protein
MCSFSMLFEQIAVLDYLGEVRTSVQEKQRYRVDNPRLFIVLTCPNNVNKRISLLPRLPFTFAKVFAPFLKVWADVAGTYSRSSAA